MAKNVNIDLKQLGESLKKINLGAFKKYASLFPSIGLLLAAIVIYAAASLVGRTISKKMDGSVSTASQLRSVATSVPSEKQARIEEDYVQKNQQDVNAVEMMAINTSRRELVCYSPVIFPKPTDSSGQVYDIFGKQYRTAIEALLERIKAKDAPSNAEIRSATGVAAGTPGMGGDMMMGLGTQNQSSSQQAMVDAVCLKRAEEIPVYANPSILSWYGFWEKSDLASQDESLGKCWSSQVAFWIYEDIIATTEAMNAGSTRIAASPVKRLLGVRFDGPVVAAVRQDNMMGTTATQTPDIPVYVKNSESTAAATATATVSAASPFTSSPLTGRFSNEQLDVVHFAVSVIVDSSLVSSFMKELCSAKTHTWQEAGKTEAGIHNQITILQFSVEPVIRDNPVHSYYRYGKAAVVQLNLVCEYLFYRKGYDAFKPDVVKKDMGEQAGATDPQAGGPGAGFPGM